MEGFSETRRVEGLDDDVRQCQAVRCESGKAAGIGHVDTMGECMAIARGFAMIPPVLGALVLLDAEGREVTP